MSGILEVKDLAYAKDGKPIISGITFTVNEGDVVVLRGVSGAGYVRNPSHVLTVHDRNATTLLNARKSTLLKCIAHLDVYSGHVLFMGKPPAHYGMQADI